MADKNPESNYDKLQPAQKEAVDWFVNLQYQRALISGNTFAINNGREFIENGRRSITTDNESGLRQIMEDFNNPDKKAATELYHRIPSARTPQMPIPTPPPPEYPTPTPPVYAVPTPLAPPHVPTPPQYTAEEYAHIHANSKDSQRSLQLSDSLKETIAKAAGGVASMLGAKEVVGAISEGLQNIPNAKTPSGKGNAKE